MWRGAPVPAALYAQERHPDFPVLDHRGWAAPPETLIGKDIANSPAPVFVGKYPCSGRSDSLLLLKRVGRQTFPPSPALFPGV